MREAVRSKIARYEAKARICDVIGCGRTVQVAKISAGVPGLTTPGAKDTQKSKGRRAASRSKKKTKKSDGAGGGMVCLFL